MMVVFRLILLFVLGLLTTQTWGYTSTVSPVYNYDANVYFYIDRNIESDAQKPNYDNP